MEEYIILVAHFDAGFEATATSSHVSSAPKRRPSMVSMPPIKSSGSISSMAEEKKDEEYDTFSKQALITEVEKLQVRMDKSRRTMGNTEKRVRVGGRQAILKENPSQELTPIPSGPCFARRTRLPRRRQRLRNLRFSESTRRVCSQGAGAP